MNKDQIIDEAYQNYLTNFIPPTCPPNLDVQPSYYEPMTKEWFIKSIKERGLRGEEFSEKWGLKIEERELSLEERKRIYEMEYTNDIEVENNHWLESKLKTRNIPAKQITLEYNNEKTYYYE